MPPSYKNMALLLYARQMFSCSQTAVSIAFIHQNTSLNQSFFWVIFVVNVQILWNFLYIYIQSEYISNSSGSQLHKK